MDDIVEESTEEVGEKKENNPKRLRICPKVKKRDTTRI